jgi:hypothetical protein
MKTVKDRRRATAVLEDLIGAPLFRDFIAQKGRTNLHLPVLLPFRPEGRPGIGTAFRPGRRK